MWREEIGRILIGKAIKEKAEVLHLVPRAHDNLGEQVEEVRGTVTMIAGGLVGGGDTSSARRKYSRSVIQVTTVVEGEQVYPRNPHLTFSDEDFKGVAPHEHDLMDPIGELRDDRRPHPTEDLKVMTYIF
ncbi:hypothetical protein SESBI_36202 [Sesbania bispinosa]|nr:hypothetical protein SESBI_36202 [Sesbania bispinosa]